MTSSDDNFYGSDDERKFMKFEKQVKDFVNTFYENTEITNKKQAIRSLKNIIFVYIDEIEEGNINTFSPHEAGVMPSFNGWGIYPPDDAGGDDPQSQINLFLTLNDKVVELMATISSLTSRHFYEGKNNSLKCILKKINDIASEIAPVHNGVPLCQYGRRCYRLHNRNHCIEYSHPWFHY